VCGWSHFQHETGYSFMTFGLSTNFHPVGRVHQQAGERQSIPVSNRTARLQPAIAATSTASAIAAMVK